jgi:hypothetical protein
MAQIWQKANFDDGCYREKSLTLLGLNNRQFLGVEPSE